MKNVKVKNSSIQGKGVFAAKDIKAGAVVLEIDDSHIVKYLSSLTKEQHEFDCDYLSSGTIVLMQEPEKYINHSCDPSAYVKTINGVRNVLAMHDIKTGEEITYDYSMNSDNEGTFECNCGSSICRRIYNGNFFKLPIEVQKRYIPYLDSWFVQEHIEEIERIKSS